MVGTCVVVVAGTSACERQNHEVVDYGVEVTVKGELELPAGTDQITMRLSSGNLPSFEEQLHDDNSVFVQKSFLVHKRELPTENRTSATLILYLDRQSYLKDVVAVKASSANAVPTYVIDFGEWKLDE